MIEPAIQVLIAEDEPQMASILVDYLRQAGFDPIHIADGRAALAAIRQAPPGLILLDIMLPGLDGLAICREVRAFSSVPIIMVTAKVEEIDRLLGLELGADDYICKPFSPREVVARVKAVLRRTKALPADGPAPPKFQIDDDTMRIVVDGRRLDLTRTEFRVLRLLASRPGRVYSRAQILDLAYDPDQEVSDRVIDSHIKNIRKKIADATKHDVIHACYGVGYRFEL